MTYRSPYCIPTGSPRSVGCCDALLWICASDKLLPLIYPWLHPWFAGTTDRPVLDWVAGEDPTRVLQQLAALYKLVKLRNKKLGSLSKFEPSPSDPAIERILEEASDLLIDNSTVTIRTFDGKEMNGSQLVNAITRAARSAGVSLLMLTQYGLMDALGSQGNMAKRKSRKWRTGGAVWNSSWQGTRSSPSPAGAPECRGRRITGCPCAWPSLSVACLIVQSAQGRNGGRCERHRR